MNFSDLQKTANNLYYPAFLLESWMPHATRKKIASLLTLAALFFFLISVMLFVGEKLFASSLPIPLAFIPKVYGIFDLVLFFWIIFFCLEAFYYSYYYAEPRAE